eukprot:2187215-Rhodomonas_salina.3
MSRTDAVYVATPLLRHVRHWHSRTWPAHPRPVWYLGTATMQICSTAHMIIADSMDRAPCRAHTLPLPARATCTAHLTTSLLTHETHTHTKCATVGATDKVVIANLQEASCS